MNPPTWDSLIIGGSILLVCFIILWRWHLQEKRQRKYRKEEDEDY